MSFVLMPKHKTSCSFSGLAKARLEINSTRALPVIARAWLRHWWIYHETSTISFVLHFIQIYLK